MLAKSVRHNGRGYYLRPDGYYQAKRYKGMDERSLHRKIYRDHHGSIPKGYHVHHVDGDRANNDIANLEALPAGQHIRHHRLGKPHPNPKLWRAIMAKGREAMRNRPWVEYKCAQCGAGFVSQHCRPRKFCGVACLEKYRANAFAGERRKCDECGKGYKATRNAQRYCGKRCNARAAERRYKAGSPKPRICVCAHCRERFRSSRTNARFCGRSCAVNFHSNHQRRRKVSDATGRLRSQR